MKCEENNSPPPRPFLPSTFKDNNNHINNNNSSSNNNNNNERLHIFMTHSEFVYGLNTHQILQTQLYTSRVMTETVDITHSNSQHPTR